MQKFDAAYYAKYYENQDTQAVSPEEQRRLAQFIGGYLRYLQIPVSRILDIGCGIGQILNALGTEFPEATISGVEVSEYLCEQYGWQQGSVHTYRSAPHDLVICNDVLGYLTKKQAAKAIKNLAKLTQSALFLSVLTEEDMKICDTDHTDLSQRIRPARWYKKRLDKHFIGLGGGLFLKRPTEVPVWQMERT